MGFWLPVCLKAYHMYAFRPDRPKNSIKSPETIATDTCVNCHMGVACRKNEAGKQETVSTQ